MAACLAELIGTLILVLLGNGVVANVVLKRTKGHDSGWIVISAGWGLAVYIAVLCAEPFSGAHLNPAVTVGLAAAGKFDWSGGPPFIVAQMAGAILGALLVYLLYRRHYEATENQDDVLATFCTAPNIRSLSTNFQCEVVATFVLVYAVLLTADPTIAMPGSAEPVTVGLGSLGAIRVGLVVFGIGLCLGGPTGYAINPARDLGPRIVHACLPIREKRDSDWGYSAIPVLGPLVGALLAAVIYLGQAAMS